LASDRCRRGRHFHAGAPLLLRIGNAPALRLGVDLTNGERPQAIVPAGAWQSAETLGDWTLLGCTVAPRVRVRRFRAGAEGWSPSA